MKLVSYAKELQKEYEYPIVLAKLNGKLEELQNVEVDPDKDKIELLTTADRIGLDAYRRSVVLLMLTAVHRLPVELDASDVVVDHSMDAGLYCWIKGNFEVTEGFLETVMKEMKNLAAENLPIVKESMRTADARKYFDSIGMPDKSRLFRFRNGSFVNVYGIDGYKDYFYGYMAPATGILTKFQLVKYKSGFVLQMPRKSAPGVVPEFHAQDKIFESLQQTGIWNDRMGLDTVASLDEKIAKGEMNRMILVQEALQEQRIVEIVHKIQERESVRFVMVAGPSSSGKTTFANRMVVQLQANGYNAHVISVDNYYKERVDIPCDASGDRNFEDLEAIDVELFNKQMNDLLEGKPVHLPRYNFTNGGKDFAKEPTTLKDDDILVIEGIHCLNDALSYAIPKESKFKIYISALTQLNIDEHNRVATTDGRLVRRLVRDFRTRNASASETLGMWDSVRRGEEKNIFPYQESADVVFNSAEAYELSILKPYVEPLLYQVSEDDPNFLEAHRMLKFLNYFLPCSSEVVPNNSILREFLGGGCFGVD